MFKRPIVKMIRAGRIEVDPTYQRYVTPSRVRKLASSFDSELFGVLWVNIRPSRQIVVLDGQSRLLAMRALWPYLRVGGQPIMVPCIVQRVKNRATEAWLCHWFNRGKPHASTDKFHALAAARDPHVLDVLDILERIGVYVVYGPGQLQARETRCGPALLTAFRWLGAKRFQFMVNLLRGRLGDDPVALKAEFLRGLTLYLRQTTASDKQVRARLRDASASAIVGRAAAEATLNGFARAGVVAKHIGRTVSK